MCCWKASPSSLNMTIYIILKVLILKWLGQTLQSEELSKESLQTIASSNKERLTNEREIVGQSLYLPHHLGAVTAPSRAPKNWEAQSLKKSSFIYFGVMMTSQITLQNIFLKNKSDKESSSEVMTFRSRLKVTNLENVEYKFRGNSNKFRQIQNNPKFRRI